MRCFVLLLTMLAVLALDEDAVVEDEPPVEELPVFVPTEEWQVIEPGQSIPPGLHVRISLKTGLKEAKLWDRFAQDQRRAEHYGHSDRRGIVNKRSKAFTREEYFKTLGDDKEILSHTPALTYIKPNSEAALLPDNTASSPHDPSSVIPNLPVTVHSEVASIVRLVSSLLNPTTTVSELLSVLDELEYHVHEIDNGRDLVSVGGLPVLLRLLNHTESDVQSSAALVIGSAAQSNLMVQDGVLALNGVKSLCSLLSSTQPDIVQRRGLFALGAILRSQSIVARIDCVELKDLSASLSSRSSRVQLKTATLVTDLAKQLNLERQVWCAPIAGLVYSEDVSLIEAGLGALRALGCDCSNYTQRLLKLLNENEAEFTELIQSLLNLNMQHEEL